MKSPSSPLRFLFYPILGEAQEHVRVDMFIRALTQKLGRPVVVEIAPNYEVLDAELAGGQVDLAWATADLCDAYESRARRVLRAVRAGRCQYQSILVCRAEEPLTLDTLAGRRAAWVAPRSAGGYLLPMRYLEARGLRPAELFSEQRFHGSYRQPLLEVLAGRADVAAIYVSHADVYSARAAMARYVGAEERRLLPFAFTEPLLADGIILTQRLSEEDTATLEALLTGMSINAGGVDLSVGPFKVERFVHGPSQLPEPSPSRTEAGRAEYLALELDALERCVRVWAPTGRAFGRRVRGQEGRPLEEVLGLETSAPLLALVRAARHEGRGAQGEYRLEVEGETRWYAAEATPYEPEPEEPDPGLTTLLVRDVTALRALEEPLYRLASFPLLHPEPLMELSLDGELHYANPSTHQAFPDLLGRGAEHPVVAAAMDWERRGAVAGESVVVSLGGRHWELAVSRLTDPPALRVSTRDVTLRRQMESRLVQSDRLAALGSLAAAVGHEMNNPLAFMLANLSFAREELGLLGEALREREGALAKNLEEVLEALGETAEGAERLRVIVQDLKTLSRKPQEYRTRVEVVPVLEDALKLVRGELRHRGSLEKDFQPVPPVEGDEARLLQVFLNLLLNAVQAMSEEEAARNVLRVATYTGQEGEVVVEVRDTGRGIAPEVQARLFEPFFTTRPSSVGLGLSVSHAIVTGLGGRLHVESQEGVGTTFTAHLPAAAERPREAPASLQLA